MSNNNDSTKIHETEDRNVSFDILKIICTFLIVFHHYQQMIGSFEFPVKFSEGKFYFGYVVDLFFIISGYLMFKYQDRIRNQKTSFKDFYLKRILRLLPMSTLSVIGFLIVTILCKVLSGDYHSGLHPSLMGAIFASGGIQSWGIVPNPWINSPLWYVGVLLVCYFLFYVINKFVKGKYIFWTYTALIIVGLIVLTKDLNAAFLNHDMARGFIGFFVGLILAGISNRIPLDNWKAFLISSLVFIGCVLGFLFGTHITRFGTGWIPYDIAALAIVIYPSLLILLAFKPLKKIFNVFGKPAGFAAGVSFEVYLWHSPMIILFNLLHSQYFQMINIRCAKIMLLFSLLLFAYCVVVYLLIEKTLVKKITEKIFKDLSEVR